MAVVQHYHVNYHLELNGKKTGAQEEYSADVVASAGDSGTLKTVLTNNNVATAGASIVIDTSTQIHGSIFS